MVYRAVTDPTGRVVVLADSGMPELAVPVNSMRALGRSELPYRKEVTWDGEYADYYVVDLATGARTRFLEREYGAVSLAPDGRHAAWFRDSAWHVYDAAAGTYGTTYSEISVGCEACHGSRKQGLVVKY